MQKQLPLLADTKKSSFRKENYFFLDLGIYGPKSPENAQQ
jgi:hypothetical protein